MKVFTKTVELTKAQIEALDSAPVLLLSAANSGYAVIPVAIQIWKSLGDPTTSSGSNLEVSYDGAAAPFASFADVDGAGALFEAAESVQFGVFDGTVASGVAGNTITIASDAAITCDGDTKLKVSVDFKIVKL